MKSACEEAGAPGPPAPYGIAFHARLRGQASAMRTHAQSGSRHGSAEEAMRLLRGGLRRDLVITESLAAGMTGPELAWICKAHHPGKPIGGMPRWRGSPLTCRGSQAVSKRGSRIKSRSPVPRGLRESLTPWTSAWQHLPAARLQHDTCGNNSRPGPLAFIALQHHSGFSGLSCTPNMDAADDLPSFTNTSRQDSSQALSQRDRRQD